jgi:hypothetical protein
MSGVLSAPSLVMIPPSDLNVPAPVVYESPSSDIAIREQLNGGPWSRKKLPVRDNDTLREGKYFASIRPGDTYEAEAYRLDDIRTLNFPDDTERATLLGSVSVRGLRPESPFQRWSRFSPRLAGHSGGRELLPRPHRPQPHRSQPGSGCRSVRVPHSPTKTD